MIKLLKPLRIVCGGMHRSGSTWLFNTLKVAHSLAGYSVSSKFVESDFQQIQWAILDPKPNEAKILKMHLFDKRIVQKATYVLVSQRDIRDVAASAVRTNMIQSENLKQNIEELIQRNIENFYYWQQYGMIVKYEEMIQDKCKTIKSICDYLKLDVDSVQVCQKVEQILPPKEGMDQDSLLWHDHITDGNAGTFNKTLNQEIIEFIEEKFHFWLKEFCYKG